MNDRKSLGIEVDVEVVVEFVGSFVNDHRVESGSGIVAGPPLALEGLFPGVFALMFDQLVVGDQRDLTAGPIALEPVHCVVVRLVDLDLARVLLVAVPLNHAIVVAAEGAAIPTALIPNSCVHLSGFAIVIMLSFLQISCSSNETYY